MAKSCQLRSEGVDSPGQNLKGEAKIGVIMAKNGSSKEHRTSHDFWGVEKLQYAPGADNPRYAAESCA